MLHYSLKIGNACLHWVRFFIRWSTTQPGGMRHPREMGVRDVKAFLSMIVNAKLASASNESHTTQGLTLNSQRLVMAQGSGCSIVGAAKKGSDPFTQTLCRFGL